MSMSDNMSVEHSAVGVHVSSLQTNYEQLTQQSNQFMSALEPLKASWKGTSVDAWNNMTQAWSENMDQVRSALDELTNRVDQAGQEYQAGEQEQTSTLQQRFAGMNFDNGPIL